MHLEAAEVPIPIEGSPGIGLHEDPEAIPPLEPLPEASQGTTEEPQLQQGRETRVERRTAEVLRQQIKDAQGFG